VSDCVVLELGVLFGLIQMFSVVVIDESPGHESSSVERVRCAAVLCPPLIGAH